MAINWEWRRRWGLNPLGEGTGGFGREKEAMHDYMKWGDISDFMACFLVIYGQQMNVRFFLGKFQPHTVSNQECGVNPINNDIQTL